MRKLIPGFFVFIFLLPLIGNAQSFNGRVIDESGKNASNVTVRLKNKAAISNTDMTGNFKINTAKPGDTLIFSAPGMETYEVVVNDKNMKDANFEVVLLNERKKLNEVVVTAYGVARKEKALSYSTSGKVSGVKVEDAKTLGNK